MHMEVTGDAINKRPCYRCTCNKFRGSLAHQPFFRHVTRLSVPCPDYKQRATPRQQLRVIVFHCKSTWPAHTRWANFKSSLETNDPWRRRRGECWTLQNDPQCGVVFQGFILSFSIPPVVDLFRGKRIVQRFGKSFTDRAISYSRFRSLLTTNSHVVQPSGAGFCEKQRDANSIGPRLRLVKLQAQFEIVVFASVAFQIAR